MKKPIVDQIEYILSHSRMFSHREVAQGILDIIRDEPSMRVQCETITAQAARIQELEANNRSAAKDLAELINYKNEQAKIIATLTDQSHPLIKCPRREKENQPDTAHTCKIGCNR